MSRCPGSERPETDPAAERRAFCLSFRARPDPARAALSPDPLPRFRPAG